MLVVHFGHRSDGLHPVLPRPLARRRDRTPRQRSRSCRRCWSRARTRRARARPRHSASPPWTRRGWLPARRLPMPSCDVTITRPPLTIGEETPRPATGAFQATFCVALHVTGSAESLVELLPLGPRQVGQSAADTVAPATGADGQDRKSHCCGHALLLRLPGLPVACEWPPRAPRYGGRPGLRTPYATTPSALPACYCAGHAQPPDSRTLPAWPCSRRSGSRSTPTSLLPRGCRQQGREALTRFLEETVSRGDVPGIVVGIVNREGPHLSRSVRQAERQQEHRDAEGRHLQHRVDDQTDHVGRRDAARSAGKAANRRTGRHLSAAIPRSARHHRLQRCRRLLRDARVQGPDHHPASADSHVRHRLCLLESDRRRHPAQDAA